jgi:hypothetical protein
MRYPPGAAPAGFYPVTGESARKVERLIAPFYDIGLRDLARNEEGVVEGVHWVDHIVQVTIGIPARTVRSAPDGFDYDPILSAHPTRRQAMLVDECNRVFDPYIRAGDMRIDIVRIIKVVSNPAWRFEWEFIYANLRLEGSEPRVKKYVSPRR